jgi:hypothetical protein
VVRFLCCGPLRPRRRSIGSKTFIDKGFCDLITCTDLFTVKNYTSIRSQVDIHIQYTNNRQSHLKLIIPWSSIISIAGRVIP